MSAATVPHGAPTGATASDWWGVNITSEPVAIRDGLSVSFAIKKGRLVAEWEPKPPRSRRPIWGAYAAARDAFLDRVCAETGLRMRVIDL